MVLELSLGASSPKKQGHLHRCRHTLTFPAHLNFVSRSTSSMVLDPSSGGIKPDETGKSSPLVKKRQISSYCRHILTVDITTGWWFGGNFCSLVDGSLLLGVDFVSQHGG